MRPSPPLPPPFVTALKSCAYTGLVSLLLLIVFVAVALASLPDYAQLSQRSDSARHPRALQQRPVCAEGPSFGFGCATTNSTADAGAMIAVEDKRFRNHLGVDPVVLAAR